MSEIKTCGSYILVTECYFRNYFLKENRPFLSQRNTSSTFTKQVQSNLLTKFKKCKT